MSKDQKLITAKTLLFGELVNYIGAKQRSRIADILHGAERECMAGILIELAERIKKAPVTYQTDGQGRNAVAWLHYFAGSSANWWITELDVDAAHQWALDDYDQAFGVANLFGHSANDGELGYISIKELIENGAEMDLFWTPKAIKELR